MIARLKGNIIEKTFNSIILDVHGVGYEIFMNNEKLKLNEDVLVFTHLQVKDDAHILYGFNTKQELKLFEKLISVKGIGCKTAIGFFHVSNVYDISKAIEESDVKFLQKLPSIGAKSAQQMILDLRGKVEFESDVVVATQLQEAIEVLKSLQYSATEIKKIEKKLQTVELDSTDEYVKKALQLIGKGEI